MLNLVIVNVGNSTRTKISKMFLTHIAWVTIVSFVQKVSYDLQSQSNIVGSRFCSYIKMTENGHMSCIVQ